MSKAPKVFCPKEGKKVPVWYCIGSFTQQRKACLHCVEATIYYGKKAEVKCDWKEAK
jgi:L-amino acid N-acyltransferase YncA